MKKEEIKIEEIMKEIKEKIKKRKAQDIKFKKESDFINNIKLSNINEVLPEEDIDYNINYLNQNYDIYGCSTLRSHRKIIGKITTYIKYKIRTTIDYIIGPVLKQQTAFNNHLIKLLNALIKKIKENLEKKIDKNYGSESLNIDYKKFEDQFRGSEESIKNKQKQFLKFFTKCNNVLDIGCGRGEFLEELKKIKVTSYGIDTDTNMVKACNAKKIKVIKEDAISHLSALQNNQLDGVFADQVLEHLSKKDIIEIINLCYRKIQKEKYVIFTTLNLKNLNVFANSLYLDLTHKTPLHPYTLKFLCETAGFSDVDIIYYSHYKDNEKLNHVKDKDMNKNIDKLNELFFGAQDYAVVCKK